MNHGCLKSESDERNRGRERRTALAAYSAVVPAKAGNHSPGVSDHGETGVMGPGSRFARPGRRKSRDHLPQAAMIRPIVWLPAGGAVWAHDEARGGAWPGREGGNRC